MISKLVAWGGDRPQAIARCAEACRAIVAGIRTTVPFFAWLLEQPEFVDGRFHTAYLDGLLSSRQGRPFVEPTPEVEDVAVIAAALTRWMPTAAATTSADAGPAPRWRAQARSEGLS
jgi:acetyl/propionyl-CoA carboxylase alpha subunit